MKWVCFILSADKIRLFFRKYKEIFKYFQIFTYKNTQIFQDKHIRPAIIGQKQDVLADIYRYSLIFTYTRIPYYIYIREYIHIRVFGYSNIGIHKYLCILICTHTHIRISVYSNIYIRKYMHITPYNRSQMK